MRRGVLFLQVVMFSSICWGQKQPDPAARLREAAARQAVREVLSGAESLRLPENRAVLEAAAANVLWTTDPSRARALYKGLAARVNQIAAREQTQRRRNHYHHGYAASSLRQQFLAHMAQRDPAIALEFLIATRPAQLGEPQRRQEAELEMQLAAHLAQHDPKTALSLVEHSLDSGWSYQFANLLYGAQQHPELRRRLFQIAWQKMKGQDFTADQQALSVAFNVFESLCNLDAAQLQTAALPEDGNLKRDMARLLAAAALDPAMPRSWLMSINVSDALKHHAPSQAADIEKARREWETLVNNGQNADVNQVQQQINRGDLEEALQQIAQAGPEQRDGLYQQIGWQAASSGKTELAQRAMAAISDPELRQHGLREMRRQEAMREAYAGRVEAAIALLADIEMPIEERINLLAQIANSGNVEARHKRRILDDARLLLPLRPEDQQQFNAMVQLAQQYAAIEDARSAGELLRTAAQRLDELVPALAAAEGFIGPKSFHEGELSLLGGSMVGNYVEQLANATAQIAPKEFTLALDIASAVRQPEVRYRITMAAAEAVLARVAQGSVPVHYAFRGGVMLE